MTWTFILISISFVLSDVSLAEDEDPYRSAQHSSVDNPWKAWQERDPHEEHVIIRRSVNSDTVPAGGQSVQQEDELYTGQATSGGGQGSHQRRHRNARNRRPQQEESQQRRRTYPEDEDPYEEHAPDDEGSMLNDESQWPENCTYCALRQANREYRLEQIRIEILAKLRLESPPNITDKRLPQYPEIDEWLRKFPEVPTDDDSVEPGVKIISMIIIAHPPPPEKILPDMTNVCFFDFQSDVEASDIVSAKLGVFVRQAAMPTDIIDTMFLIYKVKPRRRGNILIKRKRIRLDKAGTNTWYRFDVDSVVKGWVRNPSSNYGIEIMMYDDYGQSLAIVNPENEEEELYKPYIEIKLKAQSKMSSRNKRMIALECDDEMTSTTACCRYPMIVHFAWFGWDWILAPKTIQAHYCSGECNHNIGTMTHSHLAQQAKVEAYTSCCVPNKFDSLKMLYYSNRERIQFGMVNGVIVDSCGCA